MGGGRVQFQFHNGSSKITANKRYAEEFTFESSCLKVLKVSLECDIDAQAYYRGTIGLTLESADEVIKEGASARILMTDIACPPEQRMVTIQRDKKNGKITFVYEDKNHSEAAFTPYQVSLLFLCEYSV